jgi:hypothetical protein
MPWRADAPDATVAEATAFHDRDRGLRIGTADGGRLCLDRGRMRGFAALAVAVSVVRLGGCANSDLAARHAVRLTVRRYTRGGEVRQVIE